MGATDKLYFWALTMIIHPGVQGGDWAVWYPETQVCAVRGSTVVVSCTFEHPERHKVTEKMWCLNHKNCIDTTYVLHSGNKNVNSEYRGRTQFFGGKEKNCTLRIKNIRDMDAGVYKFRFKTDKNSWYGDPGVTLQLVGLKAVMTSSAGNGTVRTGDSVNLTCSSEGCSPNQTKFIWFKDKQRLPETQSTLHLSPVSINNSGKYSCAFEGHEGATSVDLRLDVEEASNLSPIVVTLVTLLTILAVVFILVIYVKRRKSPDKDDRREGQCGEDDGYITGGKCDFSQTRNQREEVSSGEEDVSYAVIQFNNKKPPKISEVNKEQSDIIYSSVVNHTANS